MNTRSQLWLAVRFNYFPLNVLGLDGHQSQPMVVCDKQRVICANTAASDKGVIYGMDITTAQLLSECAVFSREILREQQAVTELCERLYQFTPYIESYTSIIHSQVGLLLEISRCLTLFGGTQALCRDIANDLHNTFYSCEYGLAHTAKGAWLLSFSEYPIIGNEDKALFIQRLTALPVQVLRDYPAIIDSLEKMGFNTLGDVAKQIHAQSVGSLQKRFGTTFAETIKSIFAIEHNFQQQHLFVAPAKVYQPKEFFEERLQLGYPVDQLDQLQPFINQLLQKLTYYLRLRQLEYQQVKWTFYDIYGSCDQFQVQSDNAQRTGLLMQELTRIQLEQRQLPFAVDTLQLCCIETRPIQRESPNLNFHGSHRASKSTQDFAITAAKLKARLGDAAVFKMSYCDSHLPEISNNSISLAATANQQLPTIHRMGLRPSWLLPQPLAIESRVQGLYWHGRLQVIAGPERIQNQWWDKPIARDYFLAQRHDNARLWIFVDLHTQQWFVQGFFS